MRNTTELFMINGKPILLPDAGVDVSYEDLDSADSGRDESGVMHRIPVRFKVGSWTFSYAQLTEAEKNYMENLFPEEADFQFTHPDRQDSSQPVTIRAYRSKYSLSWKNAKTGLWSKYGFTIIAC